MKEQHELEKLFEENIGKEGLVFSSTESLEELSKILFEVGIINSENIDDDFIHQKFHSGFCLIFKKGNTINQDLLALWVLNQKNVKWWSEFVNEFQTHPNFRQRPRNSMPLPNKIQ